MAARNTRTLYLPNGGTLEIPLPGSNARFEVNPPSALSFADGGSRLPTLVVGVLLGAVAGTAITVWYLNSRR
jgi:hypothetical protein